MSDRYRTICRLVACSLTLFLAACTVPVRDQSPPAIPETEAAQAIVAAAPAAPASEPANDTVGANTDDTAAATAITTPTLWQSIVERHAFVDCNDPAPAVRRWQRIFTQSPTRHAEALANAAPWISYVADELGRRGLPSEYVWLPFVESRYQAFRARGNRPAGAWQLMPATARWRGLKIADDYDGRLDFVAATRAALDLLDYLGNVFDHDWALVTMAYNAGEYRIKGALERARKTGKSMQAEHLAVSPITHEHLVKLRSLACVVARPDAVSLTLPAFDHSQQLARVSVPHAMNVSQLAALAGVTTAQWLQWNPAWRRGYVDGGAEILLPRALIDDSAAAIAMATPTPIERNAVTPHSDRNRVHVVRSGESAWQIARRHRILLAALLKKNGLTTKSILRPGQKLRLP
ncbi:MAG TPA: transglycosylase SLT domain-containing protein [Pseudomonadota bacterium]|nr:transglycosylase SLT domain-containing protein [Xanthomonadales bacterium]HQW80901.1 transglycosylase SLT domain-containing protein [Pseudomonadota bacterium]